MDDFGVLTERYCLKPQGKSAPMSQAKRSNSTATATTNGNFGFESGLIRNSTSFSSNYSWNSSASNGSFLDDHDFFPKQNSQNSFGFPDDYDYEFGAFENPTTKNTSNNSSNGSSFDLASMLLNSDPKSSSTNSYVFCLVHKAKGSVGDLLGDFSSVAAKLKSSRRNGSWESGKNEADVDDLIPGFGGSSAPVNSWDETYVIDMKGKGLESHDDRKALQFQ
ncbi:auxilin-related protein 2-like [Durio zibethinus]|uniref:Auxilin-related protein 2-like n=1 Tax=Durio zibethinus TaxID=66656 RepID=A0A6P6B610_DURZI|nr:auxilin-related protein 2-like [Durio zibethinus]